MLLLLSMLPIKSIHAADAALALALEILYDSSLTICPYFGDYNKKDRIRRLVIKKRIRKETY